MSFRLDGLTLEEKQFLENDFGFAARIQRERLRERDAFFESWHAHHFCQPAGLVGGDYCDVIDIGERLFFLVGDISGKGLAACLMMSHLHASLCALAWRGMALTEMIEEANAIFRRNFSCPQYATLVAGYAERDGTVEFVNAGQLPFLHLFRTGLQLQAATAPPLGLFPDARFPSQHLALRHGQSLLICTDGVTEACNPLSQEYGFRRLVRVAKRHRRTSPPNLIKECLKDLRSFTGQTTYSDDVTLLSIRKTCHGSSECELLSEPDESELCTQSPRALRIRN